MTGSTGKGMSSLSELISCLLIIVRFLYGRVGRLLLSILTMKNGYCPVIIPPIRRAEYIEALQKGNKGDLYKLRSFILSVIHEEMKSLKRLVAGLVQ